MERREFIRGIVGGGALIATAGFRAHGEDTPLAFTRRGRFERISAGYVCIKAGATKPFSVLHISDTHLTCAYGSENVDKQRLARSRTVTFGGRQEEALRDSISWAKEHADFLLHTGDLVDFQSDANFDLARTSLFRSHAGQGIPDWPGITHYIVGNHEFSPEMWLTKEKCTCDDAWRAKTRQAIVDGLHDRELPDRDLSFNASVVNGVNFVLVDDVFGTFSAAQVERFHEEVKKGLPIVLAMHVPIYNEKIQTCCHAYWFNEGQGRYGSDAVPRNVSGDWRRQREDPVTRDFIAYLKSEKLLKGILAGHLHIDISDDFSPTAKQHVVGGNFMFRGNHVLFT